MDNDRLINLLPEEYRPEPEFKAFPIFAAALIIGTILLVFLQYQADNRAVLSLKSRLTQLQAENEQRLKEVDEFIQVQKNARFISSYVAVIPKMVLQAPDYWEIYNEIERLLPEDTWVRSIVFKKGRGPWPDIFMDCYSKGYSSSGPLLTYDRFRGTPDNPTRFRNVRMGGYQRVNLEGTPGWNFQIQMEIKLSPPKKAREVSSSQ